MLLLMLTPLILFSSWNGFTSWVPLQDAVASSLVLLVLCLEKRGTVYYVGGNYFFLFYTENPSYQQHFKFTIHGSVTSILQCLSKAGLSSASGSLK